MALMYVFNEEEIIAIERTRKENKNKREEARLKTLELRATGATAKEVSEETGGHHASVTRLDAKYRDHGLEAIWGNQYGGNRRHMSMEEAAAIRVPFCESAKKGEIIEVKEIEAAYKAAVDHPISIG